MNTTWVKRGVAIGGIAVLVAGGGLGITHAQTATPDASARQGQRMERMQGFLDAVASDLGVSPDQLRQAMQSARTQTGMGDHQNGAENGHAWTGRQGARGMRGAGAGLNAAAQAIGISPDELRQELPGKSLTDVARAHNVDPATVANALKSQADGRIDQMMTQTMPVRGQRG